jgi:hypothetical protein
MLSQKEFKKEKVAIKSNRTKTQHSSISLEKLMPTSFRGTSVNPIPIGNFLDSYRTLNFEKNKKISSFSNKMFTSNLEKQYLSKNNILFKKSTPKGVISKNTLSQFSNKLSLKTNNFNNFLKNIETSDKKNIKTFSNDSLIKIYPGPNKNPPTSRANEGFSQINKDFNSLNSLSSLDGVYSHYINTEVQKPTESSLEVISLKTEEYTINQKKKKNEINKNLSISLREKIPQKIKDKVNNLRLFNKNTKSKHNFTAVNQNNILSQSLSTKNKSIPSNLYTINGANKNVISYRKESSYIQNYYPKNNVLNNRKSIKLTQLTSEAENPSYFKTKFSLDFQNRKVVEEDLIKKIQDNYKKFKFFNEREEKNLKIKMNKKPSERNINIGLTNSINTHKLPYNMNNKQKEIEYDKIYNELNYKNEINSPKEESSEHEESGVLSYDEVKDLIKCIDFRKYEIQDNYIFFPNDFETFDMKKYKKKLFAFDEEHTQGEGNILDINISSSTKGSSSNKKNFISLIKLETG